MSVLVYPNWDLQSPNLDDVIGVERRKQIADEGRGCGFAAHGCLHT